MAPARRIASIWLPRAGAERLLRRLGAVDGAPPPLAVVAEEANAFRIVSVSAAAEAAGVRGGQTLADARAVCPELRIETRDPEKEMAFFAGLRRWAGRYSPWVGVDGDGGLALDITGCAHLFGGEAAMIEDLLGRLRGAGFTAAAAIADTKGAAWALARFGRRSGRAEERTSAPIAPPGETRAALAPLPIAALRIAPEAAAGLARVGLKTIGALAATPRASVARRFGAETVRRLDQALGAMPEPVAPAAPPSIYAVRLSLPEPIGTVDDVMAALDRLLERLSQRLATDAAGARTLRLTVRRVDRAERKVEVALARPSRDPARIRPLFDAGVAEIDAGFGIDALRLQAVVVEPLAERQTHAGPDWRDRRPGPPGSTADPDDALADLLGRLGVRLGIDAAVRPLPAESHAPEKAAATASAAYSEPAEDWLARAVARPPRPLTRLTPEPVDVLDMDMDMDLASGLPLRFRWRGREHGVSAVEGPERIAPEWWLDDPDWRSGVRDYWRIETEAGARLWLFHTPQADRAPRWFAAGIFA